MPYNPDIHHRRSIRLKGYDYSQNGAYFITICTQDKECLFGDVLNGKIQLNEYGKIIVEEWKRSMNIRNELKLDEFVIMPNHVHAVVMIMDLKVGATGRSPLQNGPRPKSIGAFIAGFKSSATKKINQIRNTPGIPVWQRNYYEHIIRNERELNQIRDYIINNPLKWSLDEYNPDNIKDNGKRIPTIKIK